MIFCYSSLSGQRETNSFKIGKKSCTKGVNNLDLGARQSGQGFTYWFWDSSPLFQINRTDRIEDWPLKTAHELLPLFPHFRLTGLDTSPATMGTVHCVGRIPSCLSPWTLAEPPSPYVGSWMTSRTRATLLTCSPARGYCMCNRQVPSVASHLIQVSICCTWS